MAWRIDISKNAKDAWSKVREVIRGTQRNSDCQVEGITAQILNDHYAAISTDTDYLPPVPKQTVMAQTNHITN